MNWNKPLRELESQKKWDLAIVFMQNIVEQNPESVDGYLSICYLLMNLLVEEEYDVNKHDYYASLLKRYFNESYKKFSNNPEYLYYMARIAYMSEWYLGITLEKANKMLNESLQLDPENIIYLWSYYGSLDISNAQNKKKSFAYAEFILKDDSPIKKILLDKGSLGEYVFDMMSSWANKVLYF